MESGPHKRIAERAKDSYEMRARTFCETVRNVKQSTATRPTGSPQPTSWTRAAITGPPALVLGGPDPSSCLLDGRSSRRTTLSASSQAWLKDFAPMKHLMTAAVRGQIK